jgi:hypothetical protein
MKIKLVRKPQSSIIKKFPLEVIKFERLLKKIGYYDNSPIIKNVQKLKKNILKEYNDKFNIEIIGFIYYYPNKKSYIWRCYQELLNNPKLTKKEIIKYLLEICRGIIFTEKTRMAEVGWEILYSNNLLTKSKRDLFILYLHILKDLKILLIQEFFKIKPKPGDILVSRPRGLKFKVHNINTDWEGMRQRSLSAQKMFNFGKLNEFGDQYARYDDNLNLHPT